MLFPLARAPNSRSLRRNWGSDGRWEAPAKRAVSGPRAVVVSQSRRAKNRECRMGDGLGNPFDVFFSYHRRDHARVEAVARALTERGLRVFLDRWYLTPGQPWPLALERTLARCNSVAVFLGADGLGPWQQRERDLALDRQGQEPGFPVIPVLLTRIDPALGFLKLNTWVDLSSNVADQAALDILSAAIRRE